MAVLYDFNPKQEGGPEKPSPSHILESAAKLGKSSMDDEIACVLKAAAAAELDPLAKDSVLSAINKATGRKLTPLKKQLALYEQELGLRPGDLALDLARRIRKNQFNDGAHLTRCVDGSYWAYQGTHWRETTDTNLRRLILEEANKCTLPPDAPNLPSLVGQTKTLLDDLLGTDGDPMGFDDEPSPVVNCMNGEVWVDQDGTVSKLPHRPESRLTACLPIDYDLGATCPTYDQALLDIFGEANDPAELVRHWHELIGYAIQPRRDLACYCLLIGQGANGKTMLLRTLQRLLGPDAVLNESIAKFMRDRFNTAYLQGKKLLIDDDISEGVVLDDGLLKQISESKQLSARRAYGRRKVNFICRVLPVMAGNSFPITKDISPGMVRRAMVIPFDRVFGPDKADPNLFPKIWKNEMEGVLNRSLEGLRRLRKRGGFKLPLDCERASIEFFCHANPLMGFIEDRCVVDPEGRTPLAEFREAMKVWARDQGIRGVPADKRLKRKLEGLGWEVKMVNGYNRVYGLRLKP